MNRNLDGSRLTSEQLEAIALTLVTADCLTQLKAAEHNAALIRSRLASLTARVRFEMFCDGTLRFATEIAEPDTMRPLVVDEEILAFVRR